MTALKTPMVWIGAVLLATLILPVNVAHASLGFESTEFSIYSAPPEGSEPGAVGPPELQAGAHPYDVRFSFSFDRIPNSEGELVPDEAVKDLEVDLPPGLIGNPLAVPQCLQEEFEGGELISQGCPQSTQIGAMRLVTTSGALTLPVLNLKAPADALAQFGVFALFTPIVMNASVRSNEDYGLRLTLHNLPQFLPVEGGLIDLWGVPADGRHDTLRGKCLSFEGESTGECPAGLPRRPFLTLPVRCGETPVVRLRITSWEKPEKFVSDEASPLDSEGHPLALDGCDALDFRPQIGIRTESKVADAPSAVEISLRLPQSENPDGLGEAEPRNVILDLPSGLSLNPAAGDGLGSCSLQQIALESLVKPSCPNASHIGSLTLASLVVAEPLQGSIYLASPQANPFGTMFAVYLVAEGDGVLVKIAGRIDADPEDGKLSVHLEDLPQLPFSDLSLQFEGGPRAPLALPVQCGTFSTRALLRPYSSPAETEALALPSSFSIDDNCGNSFSPEFLSGATNPAAGHRTDLMLRLARREGEAEISRFSVDLPQGLLPLLGDVRRCPNPQAQQGDCLPASRIGSMDIAAGAGSHPFHFSGAVFLTGPYKGAPFGLAIVVPAVTGPFDLGRVVIRASVFVDPRTGRLTISADPFPQVLGGIPLRIQSLELTTTEHPGIFTTPTSCHKQEITGTAVNAAGGSISLSAPFFVADCGDLRFSPRVSASTEGHASRRGGAALRLAIRNGRGRQANLRSVTVGFPSQLSPRLSAIQAACPAATYAGGAELCPPTSVIGTANIQSPIFDTPFEGSAYLISRGKEALPRIVLILNAGGTALELFGSLRLAKTGSLSATFNGLPDAPISSFALTLPKGPHSALGANFLHGPGGPLCERRMRLTFKLTGYNGDHAKRDARVRCNGV
jgi:hypothetical protein